MAVLTPARRLREPVQMMDLRNGFFPGAFVWRGRRHAVNAVIACRTENRGGRVRRHLFQVRADGALFELAQDVRRGQWQLEHVWPMT